MLTKESFRVVLVLMLSMSTDVNITSDPENDDILIELVDGEQFRIRVLDIEDDD